MQWHQFGVDLGGTKTEIIVLDDAGQTCFRNRRPTPATNYAEILNTIVALVREAEQATTKALALGVGAPGAPVRTTGLMKNANTTCLIDKPLQADLSKLLGIAVQVENDANCFTLSEATDGAGEGADSVFGVILGTGVGGGICLNGTLIRGKQHIAGEWGHNPLPRREGANSPYLSPKGRACYCTRHDCIETYLSGPGLSRTYAELAGSDNSKDTDTQAVAPTAAQIAERAERGEALARQTIDLYIKQLAAALGSVINILDPDTIVLGGGVSNIQALYTPLKAALPAHVFSESVQTEILKARHGDSSGVRGAAWLFPAQRLAQIANQRS
jgi:fructokinase